MVTDYFSTHGCRRLSTFGPVDLEELSPEAVAAAAALRALISKKFAMVVCDGRVESIARREALSGTRQGSRVSINARNGREGATGRLGVIGSRESKTCDLQLALVV